jgi:hypothetical protein
VFSQSVWVYIGISDLSPNFGGHGVTALPDGLRWWHFGKTDSRVALSGIFNRLGYTRRRQQITFAQIAQSPAKPGRPPHFIIAANPSVRQPVALFDKHVDRVLIPCQVLAMRLRNARNLHAFATPLFRQKQSQIRQRMAGIRRETHANRDLTIFDFAQPSAPLPCNADAHLALLGKRGRIKSLLFWSDDGIVVA